MQETIGSFDPCMAMSYGKAVPGPMNSESVVSAVAEKVVVAKASTPTSSGYKYDFGLNSCSAQVARVAQ